MADCRRRPPEERFTGKSLQGRLSPAPANNRGQAVGTSDRERTLAQLLHMNPLITPLLKNARVTLTCASMLVDEDFGSAVFEVIEKQGRNSPTLR